MTRFITPHRFAIMMDKELDANVHKGCWMDWQPSEAALVEELAHHFRKLQRALQKNASVEVTEYAADMANILMKTVEQFGEL